MKVNLVVCLLVASLAAPSPCQPTPPGPDRPVDGPAKKLVIDALFSALRESYVFPDIAGKMESSIRSRQDRAEYETVASSRDFAARLTEHLQEISRDKHLRVIYSVQPLPQHSPEGPPPPEEIERQRRQMQFNNYGFEKLERMRGNVGYLDLRGFLPPEFAGETAVAAMNFLASSDAIIFDLRQNGGGSPAMVALLSSFLFDSQPVHLNSLYWRPRDFTHQWWTLPWIPGRRSPKTPMYVVTSRRTFSAAEEFTYNLKNLKRATIVGETTGGGAHPGGFRRLGDHFGVFVPSGRAVNPISKTNWEGAGVEPDRKVEAGQALAVAHLDAVETLAKSEKDPDLKRRLQEIGKELREKPVGEKPLP